MRLYFEKTRNAKDGIVIETLGDYFAAAHFDGALFTVLPQFGEPLSPLAHVLLLVVFLAAVSVIVSIYRVTRWLMRPFAVLSDGVARVESGDLSYRIPLEKTFG